MRAGLIALILLVAACGKSDLGEFKPIVDQFRIEAQNRGYKLSPFNLKVHFGDLPDDVVGVCHRDTLNPFAVPDITVDETYWDEIKANDLAKEELIFHEMGHCILARDHDETRNPITGVPNSIMYPRMSPENYREHRAHYVDELFANAVGGLEQ